MPIRQGPIIAGFRACLQKQGYASWPCYLIQTKIFLRWLSRQNVALADLTAQHLSRYLAERKANGLKGLSLRLILSILRTFCRYGYQRKRIPKIPVEEVSLAWLDVPGGYSDYHGVFRKFFRTPHAIVQYLRLPFAKDLEDYLGSLIVLGHPYAKHALHHTLRDIFFFQRYLERKKKRRLTDTTSRDVEVFLRRQSRPSEVMQRMRRSIERFLVYSFRKQGRVFHLAQSPRQDNTPIGKLVREHSDFCRIHRGLRKATLKGYRKTLESFRGFLTRKGIHEVKDVILSDLDSFVTRHAAAWKPRSIQGLHSALRSFFRFLYLKGHVHVNVADRLYPPSCFRSDLRPKYLPWDKIKNFLASIARSSLRGKRDFAILILLASYGLRAREVSALRIADIDFKNHRLLIRERKGGRPATFPMSKKVATALKAYLKVRPRWPCPELFLTLTAPLRPLGSVVSVVVRHLIRHFGRSLPIQGAYLIRHSFAKAMLDRGARMSDVGAVLGHQSLTSTLVYTRIATEDLREVADNYANLL